MKVTLLGSGCWDGSPAPFCDCRVCVKAATNLASKSRRTRPQLLVEGRDTSFLIELSPDIRDQSARHKLSPPEAVFISHDHYDHMYGLYELHAWVDFINGPITIYASDKAAQVLSRQFSYIDKKVLTLQPFCPVDIGNIRVTPFPVYHVYGLDESIDEDSLSNAFGFVIESGSKKVVYMADFYRVGPRAAEVITKCDTLVSDGTYLFEDLYPAGVAQKASLDEHDPDHLHGNAIIDFASGLGANKVVYHSISHMPERFHEELQATMPTNHYVGYDGMVVLEEQ